MSGAGGGLENTASTSRVKVSYRLEMDLEIETFRVTGNDLDPSLTT